MSVLEGGANGGFVDVDHGVVVGLEGCGSEDAGAENGVGYEAGGGVEAVVGDEELVELGSMVVFGRRSVESLAEAGDLVARGVERAEGAEGVIPVVLSAAAAQRDEVERRVVAAEPPAVGDRGGQAGPRRTRGRRGRRSARPRRPARCGGR